MSNYIFRFRIQMKRTTENGENYCKGKINDKCGRYLHWEVQLKIGASWEQCKYRSVINGLLSMIMQ